MFDIFNQGWVGSTIGLVGVLIGFISYVSYRNSKIGPRPTCQLRSATLIGKVDQEFPSDISVFFADRKVPRLTLTLLYFWNDGKDTILGTQVVNHDPIRFEFDSGDEILDAYVGAETRKVNKLEVIVPPDEKHQAIVRFDFLDPQDGARIALLHTSKNLDPKIHGTIRGIPKGVVRIGGLKMSAMDKVATRILLRNGLVYKVAIAIGIFAIIVGLLPNEWLKYLKQVAEPKHEAAEAYRLLVLRTSLITLGAIYSFASFFSLQARRDRYPDALNRSIVNKD